MCKDKLLIRVTCLLLLLTIAACICVLLRMGNVRLVAGESAEMLDRFARLEAAYRCISEDFYLDVDEESLLHGALSGMLASLGDPYSFYYTPEQMASHNESLDGAYHGVGLLLQASEAGELMVVRVYDGSPADAAGVVQGDIILAVDGQSVSAADSRSFHQAALLMAGEDGAALELTLRRGDEELSLAVVRGSVETSSVASAMLKENPDEKIGYIAISQFSGDDVQSFREALTALENGGMTGLVIDLRNNPGGMLGDVVEIADALLGEGLIVYTENRAGERVEYRSDAACTDVPLAVLVNGNSASASEILAAAVQDHARGTIVGSRSYGKGIVQTLVTFPEDGSGMQYTSARYFTPSGACIHETGVTPDVLIEADGTDSSLTGTPDPVQDVQLRAAIKALESPAA